MDKKIRERLAKTGKGRSTDVADFTVSNYSRNFELIHTSFV